MIRIPKSMFPDSIDAMSRLAYRSGQDCNRSVGWSYLQRILWAYDDMSGSLMMLKVKDALLLEMLPSEDCKLILRRRFVEAHTSTDGTRITSLYKSYNEPLIGSIELPEGVTAGAIATQLKAHLEGRITVKSLGMAKHIVFDKVELYEGYIKLIATGSVQVFVKKRKVHYYRPPKWLTSDPSALREIQVHEEEAPPTTTQQ